MIAFLESKRAGLFSRQHLLPNIIAGCIVGVVALPLSMAFAIASGAKPEQGIYTAIIAGFMVSTLGGSRFQVAGPTGAFVVILASISARYGIEGLQIATVMAGVMLFLFGITRMGQNLRYIPYPVILGFTSGIAVVIWVGQWKYFFGLPDVSGEHFHQVFWHLCKALPQLHPATTLLALASLLIILGVPRVPFLKRVPGPLVALVLISLAQALWNFEGVRTIGTAFGGIPSGLPSFQIPHFSMDRIMELMAPAFTIAMLGGIESLLSAVVADGMAGTRHDSNQELIGQGLANMLVPFFGGFAATGALARTATNVRNGGVGPLSGIIHSLTLVLTIIFLAPLANSIPLAVLAAILFVVAWNMGEFKHLGSLLARAPRADAVILLVTFGLTVLGDLVVAVNIGTILSILYFIRKMANSVEIKLLREPIAEREAVQEYSAPDSDLMIFEMEGPFFFAAVENINRAMVGVQSSSRILIIRLRWVPFIDLTGILAMEKIIQSLQKSSIRVILSGANPLVLKKLERGGILEMIGRENNFQEFDQALKHARGLVPASK